MDFLARRVLLAARIGELGIESILITQLPNIRYLTGYTGSNGQVLLTAEGKDRFFTDGRYIEQSRREVPDMERVIYSGSFADVLAAARTELEIRRLGFEGAGLSFKSYTDLAEVLDATELVAVNGLVEGMRWTKDAEELASIRDAQAIADEAFDGILPVLREGVTELEMARALRGLMESAGAEQLAFDTIVAFGPNAAEPHHEPTERVLSRGEMIKMDFGAVSDGYHSDMTRTVALGEPSAEMREMYELVRASQQAGIDASRAGATGGEIDAASRGVIEAAGFGAEFSHGLGHGVGLEIHEGPTVRSESKDVLPAGTVVTIEPGIYRAGVGGVRIEDMVEITDSGCHPIPSSTKELVVL